MNNRNPHSKIAGGFSPTSGTIDFYLRLSTFLHKDAVAVDLGAGRGAWFYLETNQVVRRIRDVKSQVKTLIGVDVDPAVLTNPTTTENKIMEGQKIPLEDQSVDVIYADYVIEHVRDPEIFKSEIERILKPGGVFCARTPHSYCYAAIAARLIPNSKHANFLKGAQPHRHAEDVFPTAYRMNTLAAIHRTFAGWQSQSFVYRTDPAYYFGNIFFYHIISTIQKILPSWFSGNIMVFLQKP